MRTLISRGWVLGWVLGWLGLAPSGMGAVEASAVASLREALEDLGQTFGARYPGGAGYEERLVGIESGLRSVVPGEVVAAEAAFEALRREALLANPLVCAQPILFVVRTQYRPDHHNTATFFPAAAREYNDGVFVGGSALKAVDVGRGGKVVTLFETREGVVRDPEVDFDGERVVFALRRDAADSYHIMEIAAAGGVPRALTSAPDVDDFDPFYLPDGGIGFSSTREPKYCMCNRHIMANLHRMGRDGANIHQIGKSTLFEGHGSVLADGRILYDRWEYVDRNFGDAQALWAVNPDGTGHAVYWGNNTASPGAVIDARGVPGTDWVMCVFGSCHDRPWGALALIDRRRGLDGVEPVIRTWPADARRLVSAGGWEIFDAFASVKPKYEDPYPLSSKYFLASRMIGAGEQMGLYLLDVFGNEVLVHAEPPGCFDPMPLGPRPRPPVIPERRDFEGGSGHFYVQDVYRGTHMRGVERGSVRWLRVVESPEKRYWTRPPWGGQGQEAPAMNWHDFNNKRILGQVPVAEDGSVYFAVPAEKFVYFQLLDAEGQMVQSMRSGTMVQSGEHSGCVGCHEDRRQAPSGGLSMGEALRRPAARLEGWYGPVREFNYLAEVQPVLTRHCVACHDFGTEAGRKLNLAPDRDLVFNASYNELWRKKYVSVVGAGPAETQEVGVWGSRASRLVAHLRRDRRCGGSLGREDWDRLVTWIDLNAPYYPSYASAYPEHFCGRSPLDDAALARLEQLTRVPLRQVGSHQSNRGPQVSFDRPELSPVLASLVGADDAGYREALGLIRSGRDRLLTRPEADSPGFEPNATDRWREEKYQSRAESERARRAAIREGRRVYDSEVAHGSTR